MCQRQHIPLFLFRCSRMLCQDHHRPSGQSQDSPSSPEPPLQTSRYNVCSQAWKAKKCLFSHIHKLNFWSLFAGVFSTLKAVPKKEGYLGLYKGNGAMMVRIFPYGAIQFMAFDNYKKVRYVFHCGTTLGVSKTDDRCCSGKCNMLLYLCSVFLL